MKPNTTQLLLARMIAGDQTALSALYELTVDRVYGVLVEVLVSKEEAISVACDTYVFVWHNASILQQNGSDEYTWLFDVARARASQQLASRVIPMGVVKKPEAESYGQALFNAGGIGESKARAHGSQRQAPR